MTHPATKNNHETHKASIVKWYCPNLMGSDTSNYPPWCCWHQWTFINTRALAANSHQPSRNPPGCHRAIESKQSMSVSSESIMRLMISMPVLTLSHPRDTVMPRVTPRDYLASRHTDTRATSPTLWWVSRHLIGLLVSMLASDWLLSSSALTRYLHNFSFISAPWLGPAQYTGHNEYSSPEEWSACDVWLLRYSNIKCDNNGPRDITAASLCVLPLV